MKALYLNEVRKLEFKDIAVPEISEDEVLIKVKYVGVCGSDVHYYEHGKIGDFIVNAPLILGHEFSGEIVKIGANADEFKIGDRVTCEPGYGCSKCEYCKSGRYNLCEDMIFMATPPVDGCLCEYIKYPKDMVFKLPDNMDLRDGALIEPLSIGIYAALKSEVTLGDTVTILGAGCIGLVTLLSVISMGAGRVYVIDTLDNRLEKALEFNAAKCFNPLKEDALQSVLDDTDGKGCDIVIDCAGAKATILNSVDYCKKGGRIVFVGVSADEEVPFKMNRAISKELELKTIFRYNNIFKTAIQAVAAGQIQIDRIISDSFKFEDAINAFEYAANNKEKTIKAVIEMQ